MGSLSRLNDKGRELNSSVDGLEKAFTQQLALSKMSRRSRQNKRAVSQVGSRDFATVSRGRVSSMV